MLLRFAPRHEPPTGTLVLRDPARDSCNWRRLSTCAFAQASSEPCQLPSQEPVQVLLCSSYRANPSLCSPFLSHRAMGSLTDKAFGATVLGFSVALWLYYTVWVILTVRGVLRCPETPPLSSALAVTGRRRPGLQRLRTREYAAKAVIMIQEGNSVKRLNFTTAW